MSAPLTPDQSLVTHTLPIPQTPSPGALHVKITREPYMQWITVHLDNGHTEELEVEDAMSFFRERGANMLSIEKAMDRAWNFYEADIWIQKPKVPNILNPNVEPKI